METYKFFIRFGAERREVFPLNSRSLKLQYTRSESERRHAFVESFEGSLTFNNQKGDFAFLYNIEQNNFRCRSIILEIEKRGCDSGYTIWKEATLRLVDGGFDLDACTITLKPVIRNEYACWEEAKDKEVNLLSLPLSKVTVHHLQGVLEYLDYQRNGSYDIDAPAEFGGAHPSAGRWRCYKAEYVGGVNKFYYVREVLTLPIGQDPGEEWVIVQSVAGNNKWARYAVFGDYTKLFVNNQVPADGRAPIRYFGGELFAYNVVGADIAGKFDNGMPVAGLLSYFVSNYCGLKVKSNFLQINPDRSFAQEYPDFEDGRTGGEVLYQKSDIKRPLVSGNATIANFTFKKLLVNICQAYNLWWRIDNGELVIEHVSFFGRAYTLDTTSFANRDRLVRTRKYSYESEKLPRLEFFSFMEAGRPDFAGLPIEYPSDCANDNEGSNKRETIVENFTTDLELCLMNSSPDSKVVSDEGFVLMATRLNAGDGKRYTFSVPPILEDYPHLNNSLGWAYLHGQFHRHERLQANGYLNDTYQTFASVRPVKKRIRIAVKFCCSDSIDLGGLVRTDMGDAVIGAGAFLLYNEQMELDLLYENSNGNEACLKPAKFSFHHFDSNESAFHFETLFTVDGYFITEIESIRPDGGKQYFGYNPDQPGVWPATFPPFVPGMWRFRKRLVCDTGFESPWTDYITVETDVASGVNPCTATALSVPVFISQFGTKFLFRFAGQTLTNAIEVEVKRPGSGGTSIKIGVTTVYTGGTDLTVDAANNGESNIPGGQYQFRFRKVCDAAAGQYSEWSNAVNAVK